MNNYPSRKWEIHILKAIQDIKKRMNGNTFFKWKDELVRKGKWKQWRATKLLLTIVAKL